MAAISPTSKRSEVLFSKHILRNVYKYNILRPGIEDFTVYFLKIRKMSKTDKGAILRVWMDYVPKKALEKPQKMLEQIGFTKAEIDAIQGSGQFKQENCQDFYHQGIINAGLKLVKQTLAKKPSLKNEQKEKYWVVGPGFVDETPNMDIISARRLAYRLAVNWKAEVDVVYCVDKPDYGQKQKVKIIGGVLMWDPRGPVWEDEKTGKQNFLNKNGTLGSILKSDKVDRRR